MKYKHKITGEEARLLEDYYQVDGDVVPKRFIENSCDWEKLVEKDYEIIRYGDEKGNLWDNGECIASYLGDGKTHIFSVKRLSDGEVFTVGDNVSLKNEWNKGEIDGIKITSDDKIYIHSLRGGFGQLLKDVFKVKQSLFTTVDGVEIYGGESIYAVSDDFQLFYTSFARETDKTVRSFAKKENAEKYKRDNEKKYSLKDMVKIANHWAYIKSVTPEVALKVIEKWT